MKCFSFEKLNFKFGIFDDSIDCTYILHLESEVHRLKNIKTQLNKFKLTKDLYIFNNKGFKNCKKDLYKQKTNYDIIHSYLEIFKHAKLNNYNNIIILEDDFILNRVFLHEDINRINNFCIKNKQELFLLSLGLIPILYYKKDKYFNKSIIGLTTHNFIYSKKIREDILKNEKQIYKYRHIDVFLNTYFKTYFYYKPLIYQNFEETENSKNWTPIPFINRIAFKINDFFDFKNNPKKAFQNIYTFSYFISLLFIIIFIILILFIFYLFFINFYY